MRTAVDLLGVLALVVVASACTFFEKKTADREPANESSKIVMLEGYGTDGVERSCPEVQCGPDTSVSSPPDSFTAKCATENRVVKTCACGDYICVDPKSLEQTNQPANRGAPGEKDFTGYDMGGNHVSCTNPGTEIACTLIYGPQEEFKDWCNAAGHQSYTCGCHDYLCSVKR